MRAKLTTFVAGAALLLTPAASVAQSSDDGSIATAPDAPRNAKPLPSDQPDQPPRSPAADALPVPRQAAGAPQAAAAGDGGAKLKSQLIADARVAQFKAEVARR